MKPLNPPRRQCTKCRQMFAMREFAPVRHPRRKPIYLMCRECRRKCGLESSWRLRAQSGGCIGEPGSLTYVGFRLMCAVYDNRCACCGQQKPLHADHVVPLARGGENHITNIQPLCKKCNSSKGARVIRYEVT